MSSSPRRSLLDRLLVRVLPRPVAGFAPPPEELSPDLWVLDRRLSHFGGVWMPTRTSIIRLKGGSLVVISPPPLVDAEAARAIEAIGEVAQVVVPNSFHYLYASEFLQRFPSARLLVAPGLRERVPGLRTAEELWAASPEAWSGELECVILGPVRGLSEVLLFHRPTGSLMLTDVAFNMERYPRRLDRVVWRLSGIPAGFGPGRTSRSLLLSDRAAASRSLERALEWPIRQIVPAHGEVISENATSRLRTAFRPYLAA